VTKLIKICAYTFEEYVERVQSFHGFAAPGVIIGGFMIDLAYQCLPQGGFFDAICETERCLPDAIQLLTPCTIGNGWLRIFNVGRFALALYEKHQGEGIRVSLNATKLDDWPEIKSWFFNLRPKAAQDSQLLLEQIKEAGVSICGYQRIKVDLSWLTERHNSRYAVCPRCKEAYPIADGEICLGCKREIPYIIP
jgi:formylmethanofuran dehydrogenase subunit E